MTGNTSHQYRGPSIGGAVGTVLGLLGLAASVTNKFKNDTVAIALVAAAGLVIVFSIGWALAHWLGARRDTRVRGWIREEIEASLPDALAALAPPSAPASTQAPRVSAPAPAPPSTAGSPTPAVSETEAARRRELRRVANELSEELEFNDARLNANDAVWWAHNRLRDFAWQQHGPLVAGEDDDLHRSLRQAYREIHRINDCVEHLGTWGPSGDRDIGPNDHLTPEHRPDDARAAIAVASHAIAQFRQRLRPDTAPPGQS